jgi:hypothetical protein
LFAAATLRQLPGHSGKKLPAQLSGAGFQAICNGRESIGRLTSRRKFLPAQTFRKKASGAEI